MMRATNGLTCALASIVIGPLCLLILAGRYIGLTALAAWDAVQAAGGRH